MWGLTVDVVASMRPTLPSVLFIRLTRNLPEWCDNIKLSNLLLPRKGGTNTGLQLLSTSGTLVYRRRGGVDAKEERIGLLSGVGFRI